MSKIDPDAFNREVRGAQADSRVPAWPPALVKEMFDLQKTPYNRLDVNDIWRPPVVFIAIDPSGGGTSNVSLISFFYTKDLQMVVCYCVSMCDLVVVFVFACK